MSKEGLRKGVGARDESIEPLEPDPNGSIDRSSEVYATEPASRSRVGSFETEGIEDTLQRDGDSGPPFAVPDIGDFPEVERDSYEVGPEFARGGLGRILEAYDRRLNRTVAVKELISRDERAEARFVREAMITARLEHPSIVPVHEAGRWPTGERFYAMKRVQGRTLSEKLAEQTDEERIALIPAILDVCEAVAYAHSQGILHRDLKPSNVMVGSFGETVVIDWGLAKDLNDPNDIDTPSTSFPTPGSGFETSDGIVVGTPPYMAPEQAAAEILDERSDVYALGAILYHVLSGFRPYQNIRPNKVLQAVVDHPPADIEELAPQMPRDLVAIVKKAMARKRRDRYASAEEMAKELRRFLTGQLVGAHDYSAWDLFRRFVRRQRVAVGTAVGALAVLLGFGFWSVQNVKAERDRATKNEEKAMTQLDKAYLERARAQLDKNPTETLAQLKRISDLSHVSPGAAGLAAEAEDLGVAWHVLSGHEAEIDVVSVSLDGRHVASASRDSTVRLWRVADGYVRTLHGHKDRVSTLAFSGDGEWLASGSYDGTIRLWSMEGTSSRRFEGHAASVKDLAFCPDGAHLASVGEDATVRIWDLATGRHRGLDVGEVNRRIAVVFSPDGRFLLTGGHGRRVWLWNLIDGTHQIIEAHTDAVRSLAFSPDGRHFATADGEGSVKLWDVDRGSAEELEGHTEAVWALAFSPDGRKLASAGQDRVIHVWDVATQASVTLTGHTERVSALQFFAEGRRLATASWDRTVRLWDLSAGESQVLLGHDNVVSSVSLSQDGRLLASGSWDKTVRIWRVRPLSRRVLRGHRVGTHGVDFAPGGRYLASGGHDDQVRVWDLVDNRVEVRSGHSDHIYRVFFSPDGRWIASSSDDRTVRLWPRGGGAPRVLEGHTADVEEMAFSADGRWLASAGEDNRVMLWSSTSSAGRALEGHKDAVTDVAFSPDGRFLASSSLDGTVRIWSPELEGLPRVLSDHQGKVTGVAFSPEGNELASACSDGYLRRWDPATGRERGRRTIPGARLVEYSPDGRFIATTSEEGHTVWLCRRSHDLCEVLMGHQGAIEDMTFNPDGRALVTAGGDNTVRLWDVETIESRVYRGHDSPVFDVDVSPDGKWIASASADTTVRLWSLQLPPRPEDLKMWLDRVTTSTSAELSEG